MQFSNLSRMRIAAVIVASGATSMLPHVGATGQDIVGRLLEIERRQTDVGSSGVALTHFDEYIDPSVLQAVLAYLNVTPDQAVLLDAVYEEYRGAFEPLTASAEARIDEAGMSEFRRLSREARSDGVEPPREEMSRHYLKAYRELISMRLQADEALHRFYGDVAAIMSLEERQITELRAQVRRWLRQRNKPHVHLNPVDVVQLVATASAHENELAGFTEEAEFLSAVQDALSSYQDELDVLLREDALQRRQLPDLSIDIRILPGSNEARKSTVRWCRENDLTKRAIDSIGRAIATHRGQDASASWTKRYAQSLAPWLFAERAPERIVTALRGEVTDTEAQSMALILIEYETNRERIRERALAAAVHSMREDGVVRGTTTPTQLDVARHLLDEKELIEQTIARLEAVLSSPRRVLVREIVSRWESTQPELLGPALSREELDILQDTTQTEGDHQ